MASVGAGFLSCSPLFSLGSAILMLYEADAANTFDGERGVTLEARQRWLAFFACS
ncbi:hypothetical protein [Schaalia canis]|uniref:hypothetical protein n=1 Tax=Schaalia canis TaxID=100469 RepID=UPI0014029974|nr:hypothetical protein [Schaalia canis]